jgi:ribonuclease G
LRDIGGLVVVDFIRGNAGERRRLMRALRKAVADDPAEVRVEGPSPLGLVELSRARQRPPLASHWHEACPTCGGAGDVETVEAAVTAIRRHAAAAPPGRPVMVQAAPAVAAALRRAAPDIQVAEEPGLAPRGWRL